MPRREDLPDRLPDPYDVLTGRTGVDQEPVCRCGHGLASHTAESSCYLCGCKKFEER